MKTIEKTMTWGEWVTDSAIPSPFSDGDTDSCGANADWNGNIGYRGSVTTCTERMASKVHSASRLSQNTSALFSPPP